MADPRIYTIGWISATETESVAAQQFFDERHPIPEQVTRHDNNVYALGRICHHNVVMACLPMGEYGSTTATMVARDMLNSFPNVCLGLMVSTGGGAPSADHDIRLGDVVVSSTTNDIGGVFQYDYGKTIQNQAFQYTRMLDQPPKPLRLAVSKLKAQYRCDGHQLGFQVRQILEKKRRLQKHFSRPPDESDVLHRSNVVHHEHCGKECAGNPSDLVPRRRRSEDEDVPVIHYGLIASGNQVMMDAVVRDRLAAEKGALCFEMEAAGLMNHFPCLVVRGISNYADTHKNAKWEGYAAMAAAAYAKDVLSHIPETKLESERSMNEELGVIWEDLRRLRETVTQNQVDLEAMKMNLRFDKHEKPEPLQRLAINDAPGRLPYLTDSDVNGNNLASIEGRRASDTWEWIGNHNDDRSRSSHDG